MSTFVKLRATGSETNVDMTSHLMHSDEVRCPTEQSAAEANRGDNRLARNFSGTKGK